MVVSHSAIGRKKMRLIDLSYERNVCMFIERLIVYWREGEETFQIKIMVCKYPCKRVLATTTTLFLNIKRCLDGFQSSIFSSDREIE